MVAPVGVWAALASPEVGDGLLVEVLQDEVVGVGLGGGEERVDDRPGRRRQKGGAGNL